MTYPQKLHEIRGKQSNICIAYSTKDRPDLSRHSFPALTAEGDFDLMWMDGSATEDGRALPYSLSKGVPQLTEIHQGVTGGPDAAIVYSLSHALEMGYDYIGHVENDILLSKGWFSALMQLFDKGQTDGFNVGATTVRPYDKRTLWQTPDYSIHFGSGAGMIMFSRQGAECVLRNYRTTVNNEIRQTFRHLTGQDIAQAWEKNSWPREKHYSAPTSTDWHYDPCLLRDGMVILGSVPGYADNIDTDMHKMLGVTVTQEVTSHDAENPDFLHWKSDIRALPASENATLFDAKTSLWIVFPHQIAALFPEGLSDGWRCKWDQTFGPFTLVSQHQGATVSFPATGPIRVITGPPTPRWKPRVTPHLLKTWPIPAPMQPKGGTLTYTSPAAGSPLKAFAFETEQNWMSYKPDFRFHHLRRFFD